MQKHKLLKSQKNKVLEIIKTAGLDPFNFTWKEVKSLHEPNMIVPLLEYEDGEFYFRFDLARGKNWTAYAPGHNTYEVTEYPGNWDLQLKNVENWILSLENEVDEQDQWSEIEKYRLEGSESLIGGIINEPFSASQADQIQIGLLKVRSHLEQYTKGNEEKMGFVTEQIEYLSDAARRQGKRDWLHTCVGVIMSISASLALAPEEAKSIWDLIKVTVSGILHLPN